MLHYYYYYYYYVLTLSRPTSMVKVIDHMGIFSAGNIFGCACTLWDGTKKRSAEKQTWIWNCK